MPKICIEFDESGTPSQPTLRTFTNVIGDGAQLDYVVDHNLDSPNVLLQATQLSTGQVIGDVDVVHNSVNRATLRFDSAPSPQSVRVLALGVRNGM